MILFNKTFYFCLILSLFSCSKDENGNIPPNAEEPIINQEIFHVSPDGDDTKNGKTLATAWKSLRKATKTLTEGQTAIFEDGNYIETKEAIFRNSGSKGKPIIIKSRSKHGAKIIFTSLANRFKIQINNKSYIEVNDFYITQSKKSNIGNVSDNTDILIYLYGGDKKKTGAPMTTNCSIIGNKIEKCYEDGIKLYLANKCLLKGNEIINITHEGIDLVNCKNITIHDNKVYEAQRCGILAKGGSRDIKIYNNIVQNKQNYVSSHGIIIGGVTNSPYAFDLSGYEAYNVIAWNNIIVGKQNDQETPNIEYGIAFYGTKDCYSYNNVIIGTKYAFLFKTAFVQQHGWNWNPPIENLTIKNNILMAISENAIKHNYRHPSNNVIISNNFFYEVPMIELPAGVIIDNTNIISNTSPLFYDTYSDWRLKNNSPAIDKGVKIPSSFTSFEGTNFEIDFRTFDNINRVNNWNIGAY